MKKKYVRTFLVILALALLPIGLFILDKKLGEKRGVANDTSSSESTHSEYDLSDSSPEEFKKAFKYQMLKNASLDQTSAGPGITLGLFLVKDEDGKTVNVCEKYPTIDFVFKAEGVAFSGAIPTLIVRGPCLVASDQRTLESLPIPFSKILRSPLTQIEFAGEIPGRSEKSKIFVKNVVEFWPTDWNWVGVTLYGDVEEPSLNINGYEIISVLGQPVLIQAE
ncbi:hypothetical protein AZI86_07940 [Bdellovibrio bacteriovorus]|uniref:Uncharacterized protein n=1 Tax=Bdellovibrio bacteriovorus TaxID=959 RepID=A0A150WRW6_BDEBC|nr:hypothetical protein [Bdellovibrio bacteriovorus]KYG66945.1 hypothetical protein AZI86_07940 [Bdellovibrio bacteriovorus]